MIKEALYYQRGIRGKEAEKELLILEKRELSKEAKEEFIKKWGGKGRGAVALFRSGFA